MLQGERGVGALLTSHADIHCRATKHLNMKSKAFRNKYRDSSLIMHSFIQTLMNMSICYVVTKALSYYQGHKDVPEMLC